MHVAPFEKAKEISHTESLPHLGCCSFLFQYLWYLKKLWHVTPCKFHLIVQQCIVRSTILPAIRPEDWFFYVVELCMKNHLIKLKRFLTLKIQHILVAEASGYSIGGV